MFARDYDRAVESCKKVVEMEPNFALGYQRLGLALTFMGNHDAAIQHLEEAVERGRAGRGDLAYVYAISGRREQALRMADEFRNENRLFYGIALVHAALGNRQEAIRWLNKEYENHGSFQLMTVHLDPRFDSFHEEPEFRSLIEKLGLNL
jgi:serine/threonine-protein kinase